LVLYETSICLLECVKTLLLSSILITVEEVVSNRAHDHYWLLTDVTNIFPQSLKVQVLDVLSVKLDTALARVVETFNELNDG